MRMMNKILCKGLYSLIVCMMLFSADCFSAGAVNIVTYSVSDSAFTSSKELEMQYKSISNE